STATAIPTPGLRATATSSPRLTLRPSSQSVTVDIAASLARGRDPGPVDAPASSGRPAAVADPLAPGDPLAHAGHQRVGEGPGRVHGHQEVLAGEAPELAV